VCLSVRCNGRKSVKGCTCLFANGVARAHRHSHARHDCVQSNSGPQAEGVQNCGIFSTIRSLGWICSCQVVLFFSCMAAMS